MLGVTPALKQGPAQVIGSMTSSLRQSPEVLSAASGHASAIANRLGMQARGASPRGKVPVPANAANLPTLLLRAHTTRPLFCHVISTGLQPSRRFRFFRRSSANRVVLRNVVFQPWSGCLPRRASSCSIVPVSVVAAHMQHFVETSVPNTAFEPTLVSAATASWGAAQHECWAS